MIDEKILPVEEMLAYEEFTDRVEILRELDAWVKNIQRMASPSTALIAPRRMGKTVLLDRLVSTGGFTDGVIKYVNGRNDMYASDSDGINGLFQAFGGNYNIPVFQQT